MLQEEGDPIPERGRPRARRPMKTMTVDDDHYLALEEAARRSDRSVQELVNEAIESWLAEAELDDTEHAAIEEARAEAAEQGGIEFEAFFDELLGGQD